jgi:hypothetical protein
MEQKRIKYYQLLLKQDRFNNDIKSFSDFEKKYFTDSTSVKKLYDMSISTKNKKVDGYYWEDTLGAFYRTFACDLSWAQSTQYCESTESVYGDVNKLSSYPSCVHQFGRPVKSSKGQWSIPGKSPFQDYIFYNNGKAYNTKDKKMYDYECDGNKIVIKATTSPQPAPSPSPNPAPSPNRTKKSKFTSCPETFPIKQNCKNDKIKEIQKCLGMPAKYQTGNFGPITQDYLENAGYPGRSISEDTYNKICKAKTTPTPTKTQTDDYEEVDSISTDDIFSQ